jgi:hypothetical protein
MGEEVANAAIIEPLARDFDQGIVGFRKIKGHSGDEWNDLAERLAVKGQDLHAKEVIIKPIFRAVINKKENVFGFERFATPALATMRDFWPRLLEHCGAGISSPVDYEIWHDHCKLERQVQEGETYQIIERPTPGFALSSEIREQRRGSFSEQGAAFRPPGLKACEAPHVAPPIKRTSEEVAQDIPPHMRAFVTFQAADEADRIWKEWYSEADTESSIVERAQRDLRILGSWRRMAF